MRIALLTPLFESDDSSRSGIAKHYRYLADALANEGHDVSVVFVPEFYFATRTATGFTQRGGIDLHCLRVRLPTVFARLFARRDYVRRLGHTLASIGLARRAISRLQPAPDVIEATSFGSLGLGLAGSRGQHRLITRVSTTAEQLSASFQTFQSRAQSVVNWLERRAILRSRVLLTHTRQHARTIEEGLGLPPGTFAIVPHGIPDLAPTAPSPTLGPGITVLFAGQFTERKGIDVVLAAAPHLLQARADCRIIIAGGPSTNSLVATEMATLRSAYGPRFQVIVDPDDAVLQAAIEHCDVFTAPSRYESFGLIYLEAMRAGKVVVATRAGGIPEVVADGATGMLVPPGDAAALAAVWLRCVDHPEICRTFGAAGRRRFLAEFSAVAMARRSAELYARLFRPHPGPVV